VSTYTTRPPGHLKTLGPYPRDPDLQRLWKGTAADVERYRAKSKVTDPRTPLGPSPREPEAALTWRWINDDIRRAKRSLDPPNPARSVARGLGRSL
jgi:hypothetical protein